MSATGGSATGKRAIRLVDVDVLNSIEPDWHDPTVTGDCSAWFCNKTLCV